MAKSQNYHQQKTKTKQLNFKFHYFFPRNLKATPLIMANILLLKKITRFVLALCSDRSKWVKFLTSVETVSAPLQKLKDISKGSRETKKTCIYLLKSSISSSFILLVPINTYCIFEYTNHSIQNIYPTVPAANTELHKILRFSCRDCEGAFSVS